MSRVGEWRSPFLKRINKKIVNRETSISMAAFQEGQRCCCL